MKNTDQSGAKSGDHTHPQARSTAGEHSAEALELLGALDAELADNSEVLGDEEPLVWSTSERTVLNLIADAVDRPVDLHTDYRAAGEDPKLRIKLATELRLQEKAIADKLKRIKTDLPAPPARKSQKAANALWGRDA